MTSKNDEHWQDSNNWKLASIYVCPDDPRLVVPKRRKSFGWTFNFAHFGAYLLLATILIIAVAPAFYFAFQGRETAMVYAIVISAAVDILIVYYCAQIGRD